MQRRKKAIQQTVVEDERAPYVEVKRLTWTKYYVLVSDGKQHHYGYGTSHGVADWTIRRLSPESARAFGERKLAKLVREMKWSKQVLHIEGKV